MPATTDVPWPRSVPGGQVPAHSQSTMPDSRSPDQRVLPCQRSPCTNTRECSDARLNDIRALLVRPEHVLEAIAAARPGPVAEGSVGAGTGMICYGWKGGIGTASRMTGGGAGSHVVGVLVLANFGSPGDLRIDGVPVGKSLRPPGSQASAPLPPSAPAQDAGGSCVVVLATTAPADSRQLGRLASRTQNGLAWTGTFGEHGSGEYVIAFSTARLIPHSPDSEQLAAPVLPEDGPMMDLLFRAVAESVEEAVVNALLGAESMVAEPQTVGSGGAGAAGQVGVSLPADRLA